MQTLIDAIQTALGADATIEQKQAGALACRTVAAALDARPNAPLAMPETPTTPTSPSNPLAMLGALTPDQILDLAIAKLRAAVPNTTATPPAVRAPAFRVQLLPFPRRGGRP